MNDKVRVQILDSSNQLQHHAFHGSLGERHWRIIQQTPQIVFAVLHNEIDTVDFSPDCHAAKLNEVFMAKSDEGANFSKAAER